MSATYVINSKNPELRSIVITVQTEQGEHQVDVRIPEVITTSSEVLALLQHVADEAAESLKMPTSQEAIAVAELFDAI